MSLLLLFQQAKQFTGWTVVNNPTSNWSVNGWDYKSKWGQWSTFTWSSLQSSGITWNAMAGYTFSATGSTPGTTWTVVN